MSYVERELTQDERTLAAYIRELHPDSFNRLQVASRVAAIAEEVRDHTAGHVTPEVWESMHFPRYNFFAEAVDPMWEKFSRWEGR